MFLGGVSFFTFMSCYCSHRFFCCKLLFFLTVSIVRIFFFVFMLHVHTRYLFNQFGCEVQMFSHFINVCVCLLGWNRCIAAGKVRICILLFRFLFYVQCVCKISVVNFEIYFIRFWFLLNLLAFCSYSGCFKFASFMFFSPYFAVPLLIYFCLVTCFCSPPFIHFTKCFVW